MPHHLAPHEKMADRPFGLITSGEQACKGLSTGFHTNKTNRHNPMAIDATKTLEWV
jgi:hypothetical protein